MPPLLALGLATLFLPAASVQPPGTSQAVVTGLVRTESGEPLPPPRGAWMLPPRWAA